MNVRLGLLVPLALFLVTATTALGVGCGGKKPPPPVAPEPPSVVVDAGPTEPEDAAPPPPKSLFDRLGGNEGIAAVVDEFMKNVEADKRISKLFAKTKGDRLTKFKAQIVLQLCELSGGACKYEGKDMKAAHKGMAITEPQWDAFVEDLTLALQAKGVGEEEKNDLIVELAKFREEVVEKKAKK